MKNIIRNTLFFSFFLFVCAQMVFSQDTVETVVRESPENPQTAIVNIRTNTSGVEVYINNLYKGIAPLTIEEMMPATYVVQLRKDGWERKSVFVEVRAQTETNLYFELVPITGFLRVYSNVEDADIYVDEVLLEQGSSYDSGLIEMQEGLHTVEIKKFGFETQSKSVNIFENFLSEVNFEMEKTLFSISSFSSYPARFNPLVSGSLGSVRFNFSVTAPGSARFDVLDKNGVPVFTEIFANLVTENHSVTWNGRNSLGVMLPEGVYNARLEALPASGWESVMQHGESSEPVISMAQTVIDNSIYYPLVTSGSGGTTIGVVNPRLMPVGTTLISLNGATDFSMESGYAAFPFSASVSFTPFSIAEFSLRLGAESQSSEDSNFPVFFGGALKITTKNQNAYIGGIVRYTYSTEPTYVSVYSEPGLGFGFIGGLEYGHILVALSEEVVFGSAQGNVGAFDGHIKTAIGAQYQNGIFSSNAWVSLFSPFYLNGMDFFGMFEGGIEASLLIPSSTVVPTVGCSYLYSENNEHNVVIRFGVNFIIQ